MSGTNGAKVKGPAVDTPMPPKPSSAQRTVAQLAKDNEKLRHDLDVTSWLLAQLLYEIKLNAIQQAMSTPEGQAAIAKLLVDGQQAPVG